MNEKKREWQREYLHRRLEQEYKPAYTALMTCYPLTLDDLDGEIWKPIPDYDGYQVSNFGRVKSFKQGKIIILKPALAIVGYLFVGLFKKKKKKKIRIHQLVACAFIPNPENKPEVNHRDGNKFNNCVDNLEWVTSSENQRHAVATGLTKNAQGEESVRAKLTNKQAKYIRENPDKLTQEQLAEKFGVVFQTISLIQLGKSYRTAGGKIRKKNNRKLSDEQAKYIRNNPDNLTHKQIAEMFSIDKTQISLIQLGKSYKTAGGKIRGKKESSLKVPDEIRAKIRAKYVRGSKEFGSTALAKEFNCSPVTILNIVKEG